MIVRRILLLGSMVLLSACKEERLPLHFEQTVASGWSVEPVYKQAILEGLDDAGVDGSQATLSVRDNGLVVAVSFPDNALDQDQQERLAAYFDDLLKARTEAEKVRLRIKHEDPNQTEQNALSASSCTASSTTNSKQPSSANSWALAATQRCAKTSAFPPAAWCITGAEAAHRAKSPDTPLIWIRLPRQLST
ncbi:hypothetical protein NA647_19290 [Pseudomonas stutzeri]|uniref:hypothetical protein n=1 Tax=Stutzerimonas stutzeri TaxID=316 RepID=UPI00210D22F9|nr:hypothetical protein [Stutzerimonas stutzeri]MCQ4289556.1 hypothetical protein [Stutzerimonas stutzeri]